jgi:hypothetical protein
MLGERAAGFIGQSSRSQCPHRGQTSACKDYTALSDYINCSQSNDLALEKPGKAIRFRWLAFKERTNSPGKAVAAGFFH